MQCIWTCNKHAHARTHTQILFSLPSLMQNNQRNVAAADMNNMKSTTAWKGQGPWTRAIKQLGWGQTENQTEPNPWKRLSVTSLLCRLTAACGHKPALCETNQSGKFAECTQVRGDGEIRYQHSAKWSSVQHNKFSWLVTEDHFIWV